MEYWGEFWIDIVVVIDDSDLVVVWCCDCLFLVVDYGIDWWVGLKENDVWIVCMGVYEFGYDGSVVGIVCEYEFYVVVWVVEECMYCFLKLDLFVVWWYVDGKFCYGGFFCEYVW